MIKRYAINTVGVDFEPEYVEEISEEIVTNYEKQMNPTNNKQLEILLTAIDEAFEQELSEREREVVDQVKIIINNYYKDKAKD